MYIRESYKKVDGKKTYSYLTLVESSITRKGPRQRIILSLGNVNVPKEQWPLLVEMIERRLSGQRLMFKEPKELLSLAARSVEKILQNGKLKASVPDDSDVVAAKISGIHVEEPRMLGEVYLAEQAWNMVKMGEVLKGCGFTDKEVYLSKVEVIGRLVSPMSENGTKGWVERTALPELSGKGVCDVKRDALYRISDKLLKHKDRIEKELREREEGIFNLDTNIYLYDTTSSYFEGLAEGNTKAKRGHSKDGRPDCKQVVIGLTLDNEGFVKGHEVFEGNRQDVSTITDLVERLKKKSGDTGKEPTVIMDRGMASEKNLKEIKEEGMSYIVATRQTERDKICPGFELTEKKEIITKSNGRVEISIREIDDEVYILCRSEERGLKDKGIREGFEKKLIIALSGLKKRIDCGRLKEISKINEKIGRIKGRYSRAACYYRIEVKEVNGIPCLSWEDRKDIEKGRFDGTYLLRTNRKDLGDEEIWRLYVMLTRVENGFRNLKSNLGLRPNYHQKDERVDGHIFISILAYHLLHAIEYQLRRKGDTRSFETIKQALMTHQMVTVVLPDADGKHIHHLRIATDPDAEQVKIYETLGMNPRPIKRRHTKIKKADL